MSHEVPEATKERRLHRRYIVLGSAELHTASGQLTGELVNISQRGVLVRTSTGLPQESNLTIHLAVPGYPHVVVVSGRVAGAQDGQCAIQFGGDAASLRELLVWLAQENTPWTATYPPGDSESLPSPRATSPDRTQPISPEELEDLEAYLQELG